MPEKHRAALQVLLSAVAGVFGRVLAAGVLAQRRKPAPGRQPASALPEAAGCESSVDGPKPKPEARRDHMPVPKPELLPAPVSGPARAAPRLSGSRPACRARGPLAAVRGDVASPCGVSVAATRNCCASVASSVPGMASQTSSTSRAYSGSATMRSSSTPWPSSCSSSAFMRSAIFRQRRVFMATIPTLECAPGAAAAPSPSRSFHHL